MQPPQQNSILASKCKYIGIEVPTCLTTVYSCGSSNQSAFIRKTIEECQAQTGGAEIPLCLTYMSIALSSWPDILSISGSVAAKLAPRRARPEVAVGAAQSY